MTLKRGGLTRTLNEWRQIGSLLMGLFSLSIPRYTDEYAVYLKVQLERRLHARSAKHISEDGRRPGRAQQRTLPRLGSRSDH